MPSNTLPPEDDDKRKELKPRPKHTTVDPLLWTQLYELMASMPLEKQFKAREFELQVENASREQLRYLLLKFYLKMEGYEVKKS